MCSRAIEPLPCGRSGSAVKYKCRPPLGVLMTAPGFSARPSRLSRLSAAKPLPRSPWWSTSITSGPGAPVAIATFRSGFRDHQAAMRSGSVVASLNPCATAGTFSPGMQGNTGQPARA